MAEALTDKAQILARMAESRRALRAALDRAGADLIRTPGTWGEWSLKDLLAHIVYWQTVAIDRLQKIADGRGNEIKLYDEAEIEEVNGNVYQSNKDRPLADMMEAFHVTYQTLRTAVKQIPPSVYAEERDTGVRDAAHAEEEQQRTHAIAHTVYGDGYGHDEEHLQDVESAIQQSKA